MTTWEINATPTLPGGITEAKLLRIIQHYVSATDNEKTFLCWKDALLREGYTLIGIETKSQNTHVYEPVRTNGSTAIPDMDITGSDFATPSTNPDEETYEHDDNMVDYGNMDQGLQLEEFRRIIQEARDIMRLEFEVVEMSTDEDIVTRSDNAAQEITSVTNGFLHEYRKLGEALGVKRVDLKTTINEYTHDKAGGYTYKAVPLYGYASNDVIAAIKRLRGDSVGASSSKQPFKL